MNMQTRSMKTEYFHAATANPSSGEASRERLIPGIVVSAGVHHFEVRTEAAADPTARSHTSLRAPSAAPGPHRHTLAAVGDRPHHAHGQEQGHDREAIEERHSVLSRQRPGASIARPRTSSGQPGSR
ncbi:MAG: hypothetical protein R2838_00875 [Caldilineaceae bacterium]